MKKTFLLICALVVMMPMSASALLIDASTPFVGFGDQTATPQILAAIAAIIGPIPEAYKGNQDGTEAGAFAASYQTVFGSVGGESNETATITWVADPAIGLPAWLLAKDGQTQDPLKHVWYLYDLKNLGWDGMETIEFGQLWPNTGSFSHVSIFSDSTGITVSEPFSLLLLGLGLLGVAGLRSSSK